VWVTEKISVDTVFGSSQSVRPGSPVSLVFYLNAQPVALAASVAKQNPLTLNTSDKNAALLEPGKRALLILQDGGQFAKAEAQIVACEHYAEGWRIEAGQFGWEEVDRRRYPRHEVAMTVTVKAVLEREGAAQLKYVNAETIDMSLGGAWIKATDQLIPGSLVEFQAELRTGEHMRALAIVAWTTDEGTGLEFVDFLGGSRYYLHSFLSEAA
jgi:hypothetical protein